MMAMQRCGNVGSREQPVNVSLMNIGQFSESVDAIVLQSGDEGYADNARRSLYADVPNIIVRPRTADAVAETVRFALSSSLEISVRCGGHGAVPSTSAEGLLIDLSLLSDVEVLDDNLVRIGGGALWGDVALALAPHGLVITSGDTKSVGVGGLTLGGGVGWMIRKWGLALDNLVAVELVTATGSIVRADAEQNADLFWALRGGGGNFGVATAFTFRAQSLPGVISGSITFGEVDFAAFLRAWRDVMHAAPEELNSTVMAMPAMGPEMPASLQIVVVYAGFDEAAANAAIEPLCRIDGFVGHDVKPMAYADVLMEVPHMEDAPIKFVGNNGFAVELTDEAIAAYAALRGEIVPGAFMVRSLSGAFNRVPADATAFSWRDAEFLVLCAAVLPKDAPVEAEDRVNDLWATVKPHLQGAYGNFLYITGDEALSLMYLPETLERLRAVKQKYDPDNVFHLNQNVVPPPAG
jgi:FAD/FMN-containing dehydrogenase